MRRGFRIKSSGLSKRVFLFLLFLVFGVLFSFSQYKLHRDNSSGAWVPDPLMSEEQFIALRLKSKGIIIFSACSHAGVVNVLHATTKLFQPLYPNQSLFIPLFLVNSVIHFIFHRSASLLGYGRVTPDGRVSREDNR